MPKVSAAELQRQVAELTVRAERAEKLLSFYQDEVSASLTKYMAKLGQGITGFQPECWTILDAAINDYVDVRACFDQLRDAHAKLKLDLGKPVRRRLPDTRSSLVHKFSVASHEGYLTVGLFPEDNTPGEMFVVMAKEGSTVGGLMDTIGRLTSVALQSGVSMKVLCEKFVGQRFEPSGYTTNSEIKIASSIIDYVFRWMEMQFCPKPEESVAAS